MNRPKLLDLFCCEGGAASGYSRAGFDVVGVDIEGRFAKRYPFEFHQGDALDFVAAHGHEFDAIHASPPCQGYSATHRLHAKDWPRLIGPTRGAMIDAGRPYVIENVMDARAEMIQPFMLCGAMFGINTYRHRLFETSLRVGIPRHGKHSRPSVKMGRPVKDGDFIHVVGNFSGVDYARRVMEMPWASRDGLRESIPPAYTEHIGHQLLAQVISERVA